MKYGHMCPILVVMKGSEFIKLVKGLARRRGVDVRVDAKRGKGSHQTLYYAIATPLCGIPGMS